MRLARIIIPSVLGLGFSVAVANATCPQNYFETPTHEYQSNRPAEDWDTASYDLVAGTGEASMAGGVGEQSARSFLHVSDRFQVVGPPSATRIPIVIRLHVTGMATGGYWNFPSGTRCVTSNVRAVLDADPKADVVEIRASCEEPSVNLDHELEVQGAHLPGEIFLIETWLEFNTDQGTSANAAWVLSFGLPAGYSIASCQGYGGSEPVPVESLSWGKLKRFYR